MTACPQYLIDACTAANAADDSFEIAVRKAGYKSRWDMTVPPVSSQALRDAYFAKIDADKAMHDAFEQARREKSPVTTVA